MHTYVELNLLKIKVFVDEAFLNLLSTVHNFLFICIFVFFTLLVTTI